MTRSQGVEHPTLGEVVVQPIGRSDWKILKDLRLRALESSGQALAGDLGLESTWDEDQWRNECTGAYWFYATFSGRKVGVGRVANYPDEQPRLHLEAMWVPPAFRHQGVGIALMKHAEGYTRQQGEARLGLWVFSANPSAKSFYLSLGYLPTGRRGLLKSDGRAETEFSRDLNRPGGAVR